MNHTILHGVVESDEARRLVDEINDALVLCRIGRYGEIPVVHVHRRNGSVVQVGGEIGFLDDVREGYGVAIGVGQLSDTAQATSLEIVIERIVRRSQTGEFTIGGKQIINFSTLQYRDEIAELSIVLLQESGNHVTLKGIIIFGCGIIRTTHECRLQDNGAEK
jgi:hypothetical protein